MGEEGLKKMPSPFGSIQGNLKGRSSSIAPLGSDEASTVTTQSGSSTALYYIPHPSQMLILKPLHPKVSCTRISAGFLGNPNINTGLAKKEFIKEYEVVHRISRMASKPGMENVF